MTIAVLDYNSGNVYIHRFVPDDIDDGEYLEKFYKLSDIEWMTFDSNSIVTDVIYKNEEPILGCSA